MSIVGRIAILVQNAMGPEGSHDWQHVLRVRRTAERLASLEGANLDVVILGALLHDIADWKFHAGDDEAGPREAERLLLEQGADPLLIANVVEIVRTISFKGAGVATPMSTLEGQVVQDADRLDALGAIGIARCFAYGGHAGRALYDDRAPVMHTSFKAYKTSNTASLNHFHEKLYLLPDRMNTSAGRALANERCEWMRTFETQFLSEWHAQDVVHKP